MTQQEIVQEFRHNVRTELDLCNPVETPYLCAQLGDPATYKMMEAIIAQKVFGQQLTIGEAIIVLELELNPSAYAG